MGLHSQDEGWALLGERLMATTDGGESWQEITPSDPGEAPVLGAQMLDRKHGWVVKQGAAADELKILRTTDGGASWSNSSLALAPSPWDGTPVLEASLDFIDANSGWLALRLQSGSSFSLGRLFATLDGGVSWEERSLPAAGTLDFTDASLGWLSGGPGGEQRFRTEDGGRTWIAENPSLAESGAVQATLDGLQVLQEAGAGDTRWVSVADGRCSGDKSEGATLVCYQRSSLYRSTDGGASWSEITPLTP